ncbi:hypothetical protein F4778DRAFT_272446 [Xylariomycetidae sp. FL2044]|nr:hypothetical protein F4778DRAFT_272446 [Xylariomycetidae sp. FL2044]
MENIVNAPDFLVRAALLFLCHEPKNLLKATRFLDAMTSQSSDNPMEPPRQLGHPTNGSGSTGRKRKADFGPAICRRCFNQLDPADNDPKACMVLSPQRQLANPNALRLASGSICSSCAGSTSSPGCTQGPHEAMHETYTGTDTNFFDGLSLKRRRVFGGS